MKPRLRLVDGVWQCFGFGIGSRGDSPKVAYTRWARYIAMPPQCAGPSSQHGALGTDYASSAREFFPMSEAP
jgi:hypothetical protein